MLYSKSGMVGIWGRAKMMHNLEAEAEGLDMKKKL
jgi:hypothetical protein